MELIDTRKMYEALVEEGRRRGLENDAGIAAALHVSRSQITRLRDGLQPTLKSLVLYTGWMKREVDEFLGTGAEELRARLDEFESAEAAAEVVAPMEVASTSESTEELHQAVLRGDMDAAIQIALRASPVVAAQR